MLRCAEKGIRMNIFILGNEMSSLSERADTLWRLLVVYGFIAVLFVLNTVSFSLPVSGDIDIPFLIMAIYYWSIYRPTLLPPWLVFTMGILFDFLGGLPVCS
jgi:rod shape-determining protein MreD